MVNIIFRRDLLDEARVYHLLPERRSLLQSFRTRPRSCDTATGQIFVVGGLTKNGKIFAFSN